MSYFVVRVDYPAIKECRFLRRDGQLVKEWPDAQKFPSRKAAQREADTMGPNSEVEEHQP